MLSFSTAVCGLAAGILCSQSWPAALHLSWLTALSSLLLAAAFLRLRSPGPRVLSLFCLFACAGFGAGAGVALPSWPPHHLQNFILENQEISLTFRLRDMPVSRQGKTRIIVAATGVLPPGEPRILPATGLARLTVNAAELPGLRPGEQYLARCRLSRPRNFGTPGAFDYQGYLAADNIHVTGWIADQAAILPILPLPAGGVGTNLSFFEERRQRSATFLKHGLPPETAGLYSALLIGDRSGIDETTLELFKETGLMHLLAISGMHLAVLALLASSLFKAGLRLVPKIFLYFPSRKLSLGLTLPLLLFYAGIAGFQPPVLRALLMTTVFMAAILLDRQWSSLNNVAFAAGLILFVSPLSIFTASFQLSFAATTAIVLTAPRLRLFHLEPEQKWNMAKKAGLWLASGLVVSLAAFLATAPFSLFHFNRLSLLGPISTLLVSPLLCFCALPLGLVALAVEPLSTTTALLLLKIGAAALLAAQKSAALLATIPHASLWLPTPAPLALLAAFALALALLTVKSWRLAAAFACAFLLLLSGWKPSPSGGKEPGRLEVSYLDVGQGSATVIEMPDGSVTLIDGGGTGSETFNAGEAIIAPFLWQRHIRRLDQIILTHNHADHFNGIPFLLKRFSPRLLWLATTESDNPEFAALLHAAEEAGCRVQIAHAGDLLHGESGRGSATIACLANLAAEGKPPGAERGGKGPGRANDLGLVLKLSHGANSFLFPGDIERPAEKMLVEAGLPLRAQALLMPHHGLPSSGSREFLAAVSARQHIVSAGRRAERPGQAPGGKQGEWHQTSVAGTIFLVSDGEKITARTYYSPGGAKNAENGGAETQDARREGLVPTS